MNPKLVLDLITREKSVFDERDVAKILHRYIDDPALFQSLMVRIILHPDTFRLERERIEFATGSRLPAKYTTREMIRLEAEMAKQAVWLSPNRSRPTSWKRLKSARWSLFPISTRAHQR